MAPRTLQSWVQREKGLRERAQTMASTLVVWWGDLLEGWLFLPGNLMGSLEMTLLRTSISAPLSWGPLPFSSLWLSQWLFHFRLSLVKDASFSQLWARFSSHMDHSCMGNTHTSFVSISSRNVSQFAHCHLYPAVIQAQISVVPRCWEIFQTLWEVPLKSPQQYPCVYSLHLFIVLK